MQHLAVSRAHALIGLAAAITVPVTGRAQAEAVVRIGTPGNDGNALAYYAFENGYFRNDGIVAQIQTLRAGSGAGIAAAVIGGALDVGEATSSRSPRRANTACRCCSSRRRFCIAVRQPVSALIVAKSSAIRNGKDLNGATIAVPSLTGPAKLVTVAWLQKNGADLTTVKFVELPQTAVAAAIARGTVAAATTTEPNLAAALDDVRVLGYIYDAIGNPLQVSGWFATEDWIRANPDVARRFVAAVHEAAVWANNPPESRGVRGDPPKIHTLRIRPATKNAPRRLRRGFRSGAYATATRRSLRATISSEASDGQRPAKHRCRHPIAF